jgi:hypothetical protein
MSSDAAGSGPRVVAAAVASRLRPHPHRGDVIAAGAVPLAMFALVVALRMVHWPLGARFGVVAVIAGLLLLMGWLAELEGESPRAYHSILLVCGLLVLAVALVLFAEVLGSARPPGSGGLTWAFAVVGVVAVLCARRANSGACTLIAALAVAVAVEAFVVWVFHPRGAGTFRAVLFVLTVACGGGVLRFRDHRRRHAVQLMNAGALLTFVLGLSFVIQPVVSVFLDCGRTACFADVPAHAGFGWELWILAVGFGVIAYAGADREPGPAYFGVVLLVEFAVLVGLPRAGHTSLVGWPLFLLFIGLGGLAIGLRPRRELPPPPGGASPAPTIPLNREDHD